MEDAAWQAPATQLSNLLLAVIRVRGGKLILRNGSRYAQYAHLVSAPRHEAGSNQFLPEKARLPAEEEQQLVEFGRQPPGPPGRLHTYDTPHPSAARVRHAADLMARILRDIHQVAMPSELTVDAWKDESGKRHSSLFGSSRAPSR
jgi:hypothetical protein